MPFKDSISGFDIPVSPKSAQTINRALVAARDAGVITDHEYAMVYAECVEPPRLPQMFGGRPVDPEMMHEWQNARSWMEVTGERITFEKCYKENYGEQ